MRISEYFNLNRDQPSLEFLDVDISGDTRAFVDPRALRGIESEWSRECMSRLQNFFDTVMQSIRAEDDRAQRLLASLHEPNETHLGLSRGRAQGRGMGRELARDLWNSLSQSRAASSGLLEDLEDTVLFVDGIGSDIISDIATNIIRGQLIQFTHAACDYYAIATTEDIACGRLWDRNTREWRQEYTRLPMTDHGPLVLVPKSIVRRNQIFDPGEYFNHYVLPQMQDDELHAPSSSLVEVLTDGRRRVTKKSIKERYGQGKKISLETTLRHPDILDVYRAQRSGRQQPPDHNEIAEITESSRPDWESLLGIVLAIAPGRDGATDYHRAVEALLTALFYPALDQPIREFAIHAGRKRIDITYTNVARVGFFDWVHRVQQAPAPNVFVECKNYSTELGNPETDQLSSRFSRVRGRLGLLLHRGYGDKTLLRQRCRDTALDERGFIIALDDDDLVRLVAERQQDPNSTSFPLLRELFAGLT